MYYHGGTSDLHIGDSIQPGQEGNRRHVEGCPICAARNSGHSLAVDPIPEHDGVYVTTDREYGRYYASMAYRGTLYVVKPVGELIPSVEDRFPAFICPSATVTGIYQREVQLTDGQRRRLLTRWIEADARAGGWGDKWDAMSPADRRSLANRGMREMYQAAGQVFGSRRLS
jgi:hypothetical protein